jgi:thiamine biosynthesis protein ThiS
VTGVSITLKLFASLTDYLPAEARRTNALAVEVAANTTIDSVIEQFNLPRELCHLVVVNGEFVPRDERSHRTLREGDALAIWPPIAGG